MGRLMGKDCEVSVFLVGCKSITRYNKRKLYLHLFVVFADRRVVEAVIIGHHHLVLKIEVLSGRKMA